LNKKNIILTFDYEVFLGKDSGDIYNSLLKPTDRILEIFKENNSKGLFFVDATFLLKLKEENSDCFVKVKEQLHKILSYGSDIGLHIHPHWLDVKSIGECRWTFEKYEKFRLHNLNDEERKKLIRASISVLNDIVHKYNPNYKIDTFRAGGWCIQPFHLIADELKNIGIKYDFSVLPGKKNDKRPRQYFDYKTYPKNKAFWQFEDDIIKEVEDGYFTEVPVTMYKMNLYDWIQNKKVIKTHKIAGDGRGGAKPMPLLEKLLKTRWSMIRELSSDAMSFHFLKKMLKKCNSELLVYVAHPKSFSEDSFFALEYICNSHNTVKIQEYRKQINSLITKGKNS
jgi:hypothetical protein